MTEEKPLSEQGASTKPTAEAAPDIETQAIETAEESTAHDSAPDIDGIAAALSALSSAAAPVRDEEPSESAPAPEDAVVSFTPATSPANPADSVSSAPVVPPPPPAPDTVEEYPAPTGTPIAVAPSTTAPAASTAATVQPPAPTTKRKKWPWILAICIVAGLVFVFGVSTCAYTVMNTAFHSVQHNDRNKDYGDLFNPDVQDGIWNFYYGGNDATFEDVLDAFNVEEGEVTADGSYGDGAYRVGGENGIAPGMYYFEGTQDGVSFFYVLKGDGNEDEPRYDLSVSVEYFGNYYADLEEGDMVIFIPTSDACEFHLVDGPMDVMPPYESGCYRVGIDIPAGTYTITCQSEAARVTDSESGAFVMKDLDFNADSITETAYVIKGGRQVITVKDGDYLELFAAIATPATASTKIPLQHVESEQPHVA